LNNTIAGNFEGLHISCNDWVTVVNCIVWNNFETIKVSGTGAVSITYSDLQVAWPGTGNIKANPKFVNYNEANLHLSSGSPCMDAGDNTAPGLPDFDIDYDPRIVDGDGIGGAIVDMGADEYFLRLQTDVDTLSEAAGGIVNFSLNTGPLHGGRNYILLGSVSGTNPGTSLPGDKVTLPLNFDFFTSVVFLYLNTPLFHDFLGVLDGAGQGSAQLDTGGAMPPGSAGHIMYFAFTLNNPFNYVSNPAKVIVVP
jgi:hypothetical protein